MFSIGPASSFPRHINTASSSSRRSMRAIIRRYISFDRRTGSSVFDVSGTYREELQSVKDDFRPKRIILIRHGESMGNVDESAYVKTPDWRVPLTPKGRTQASYAGKELNDLVGPKGYFFFYCSPYLRTRETLQELTQQIDQDQIVSVREEPRISEQQFGNFQNVQEVLQAKAERHEFGRFYYRFRSGEAGLDVYSRVSSFISTLVRDCHQYQQGGYNLDEMNIVIVTHGLSLRLFLMRWFQFSVEEFERSNNPRNAQLIVMHKMSGPGGHRWYEMDSEDRESIHLPECCGVPKNVQIHQLRHDDP